MSLLSRKYAERQHTFTYTHTHTTHKNVHQNCLHFCLTLRGNTGKNKDGWGVGICVCKCVKVRLLNHQGLSDAVKQSNGRGFHYFCLTSAVGIQFLFLFCRDWQNHQIILNQPDLLSFFYKYLERLEIRL